MSHDTPPRMNREKLARVEKTKDKEFWVLIVAGLPISYVSRYDVPKMLREKAKTINTATSIWLDSKVKKAVDAERKRIEEICIAEDKDARNKYASAVANGDAISSAICASAGMATHRILAAIGSTPKTEPDQFRGRMCVCGHYEGDHCCSMNECLISGHCSRFDATTQQELKEKGDSNDRSR